MIRHIFKCTWDRQQAWKAFEVSFLMYNTCLFSFGWCKRQCAKFLLFPFHSVCGFWKRTECWKEGGRFSWDRNLEYSSQFYLFCFVSLLVYDVGGSVWPHTSFLKRFWKLCCLPQVLSITLTSRTLFKKIKKSIVFSHLWKINVNKWQQREKKIKKQTTSSDEGMKIKKRKKSKQRFGDQTEPFWCFSPFCVANDQNYMRWA